MTVQETLGKYISLILIIFAFLFTPICSALDTDSSEANFEDDFHTLIEKVVTIHEGSGGNLTDAELADIKYDLDKLENFAEYITGAPIRLDIKTDGTISSFSGSAFYFDISLNENFEDVSSPMIVWKYQSVFEKLFPPTEYMYAGGGLGGGLPSNPFDVSVLGDDFVIPAGWEFVAEPIESSDGDINFNNPCILTSDLLDMNFDFVTNMPSLFPGQSVNSGFFIGDCHISTADLDPLYEDKKRHGINFRWRF